VGPSPSHIGDLMSTVASMRFSTLYAVNIRIATLFDCEHVSVLSSALDLSHIPLQSIVQSSTVYATENIE
jgi:hypothetical protein